MSYFGFLGYPLNAMFSQRTVKIPLTVPAWYALTLFILAADSKLFFTQLTERSHLMCVLVI